MTIKLFYKTKYLSTHKSVEDAEAAARWTYFEFRGFSAPGTELPVDFFILISNNKKVYPINNAVQIQQKA